MKNIPVLPLARRYRLRMLGLFLVVSWAVLTVVNRKAVETALPTLGEVVLSTFTLGLLIVGLSILLSTAEGFDVYFARHS